MQMCKHLIPSSFKGIFQIAVLKIVAMTIYFFSIECFEVAPSMTATTAR